MYVLLTGQLGIPKIFSEVVFQGGSTNLHSHHLGELPVSLLAALAPLFCAMCSMPCPEHWTFIKSNFIQCSPCFFFISFLILHVCFRGAWKHSPQTSDSTHFDEVPTMCQPESGSRDADVKRAVPVALPHLACFHLLHPLFLWHIILELRG